MIEMIMWMGFDSGANHSGDDGGGEHGDDNDDNVHHAWLLWSSSNSKKYNYCGIIVHRRGV